MLKFEELTPRVWIFPSAESALGTHTSGVVLGEGAALLIDPTSDATDIAAIRRFLEELASGAQVRAVVHTQPADEAIAQWRDAAVITPELLGSGELPLPVVPLQGWEVLALQKGNRGRLGVYSAKERILFCGDMLCEQSTAIPSLVGGSESYIESLERIEPMNIKAVVPRRGSVALGKRAIRERIESDRSYILSVYRHVLTSQAANVTLERVLQVAAEVYDDFPFISTHLANLRLVWGELRA